MSGACLRRPWADSAFVAAGSSGSEQRSSAGNHGVGAVEAATPSAVQAAEAAQVELLKRAAHGSRAQHANGGRPDQGILRAMVSDGTSRSLRARSLAVGEEACVSGSRVGAAGGGSPPPVSGHTMCSWQPVPRRIATRRVSCRVRRAMVREGRSFPVAAR